MSKVFNPDLERIILVDATCPPHPKGTQYRVAVGWEDWNERTNHVLKVQMVYDGRVNGRRAPSYPIGSDDERRVRQAIDRVLKSKDDG